MAGDAADLSARGHLRSDHAAVRELAGEWLACDAAERGAWSELVEHASGARWPATPLTYLLEGISDLITPPCASWPANGWRVMPPSAARGASWSSTPRVRDGRRRR